MDTNHSPDMTSAAAAVSLAQGVVDSAIATLRASGGVDANQVVAYDIAHAASAVATAKSTLDYGAKGDAEARIACAFIADALRDLGQRVMGREKLFGIKRDWMVPAEEFVTTYCDPEFLASMTGEQGPRHLDDDFQLVAETFHRFAEEQVRPRAEHIHRTNGDIPEDLIQALAEIGGLGLSVPEEYGGFATGGDEDYVGMVVATEELTWGSLGIGGSLITRPEILTRALVN